jgi:hypothetical protein
MFLARVAELADAPDLGLRNHRFQNIAFQFEKQSIYEKKTRFWRQDSCSRMTTRNLVFLAQILAHGRARLWHDLEFGFANRRSPINSTIARNEKITTVIVAPMKASGELLRSSHPR